MTPRGRPGVPEGAAPGEKVLAWTRTVEVSRPPAVTPARARQRPDQVVPARTVVAASREALHLSGTERVRIPWPEVERSDWDTDAGILTVVGVAPFGREQPTYLLPLRDAARLLEVVRERVNASIVLQRQVPLPGQPGGVRLVGRRAPGSRGAVHWLFEYDEGVDPDDPGVQRACRAALEAAELDITAR